VSTGEHTVYFQSGQQTIADYTAGTAASSPTYNYVYASYIDEPVMRSTGSSGAKHFFHRNQQYSITALTDGSGAVSERYAYSAYGTPTITDASGTTRTTTGIGNRYTYTGREYDETLALYHYRARMYDSVAGRFVSRDPIGFEGSQWNVYEYVNSSPPVLVDPLGLQGHQVWRRCGSKRYQDNVRYPRYGCCNGELYDQKKGYTCKNGKITSPFAGGGIFMCTRAVDPGTPCKTVIDSCGGQHTYIQFGGLDEMGRPLPGTTGIGFSGPGKTPPGPEKSFGPTSCTQLIVPAGMTVGEATACIRGHAPSQPFTDPRHTLKFWNWYVCSTWADEATTSCGLERGKTFSW